MTMKNTRQKWEGILAAIRGTEDEEIVCNEITDEMFAVYAEVLLAAEEPSGQLSLLEQHMRQCPDCAQELNEIVESLRSSTQVDHGAMASAPPVFDLAFLAQQPEWTLPERIQAIFRQGHVWARDQEQAFWFHLAAGMGATPTAEPLGVTKGVREQNDEVIYGFSLGSEELGDLDLEITGTREGTSESCTITVQAVVPSRWPQIEGIEVMILNGLDVRSERTDERGYVSFPGIPVVDLARINVRVAPF